jgi:hypothetical protein
MTPMRQQTTDIRQQPTDLRRQTLGNGRRESLQRRQHVLSVIGVSVVRRLVCGR